MYRYLKSLSKKKVQEKLFFLVFCFSFFYLLFVFAFNLFLSVICFVLSVPCFFCLTTRRSDHLCGLTLFRGKKNFHPSFVDTSVT
jgi:hypothetical protein